ncbi:MAG: DUF1292 domain-containing protein [Clostridiales bacterium]|nr:DUF1292 domain-containing protein [Clostridiales bacterium]MCF8021122.1 DUF1292 domain-containing protein [Clostridiales bacterium]
MSSADNGQENQPEIITLLDEEGQEHQFELIDIIEVEENEYAILLPPVEDATEAVVLKKSTDEDGNEILVDIEDEDEWEKIEAAWEQFIESDDDENLD